MATENTTLNVPKDVLQPIISAHITKAVTEALGVSGRTLVESAVNALLTMKVNEHGSRPNYEGRDDKMWIDWAITDVAQKATKEAIQEYFASNQGIIKQAILKSLSNPKSPMVKAFAESLVTGAAKATENAWRMNISFTLDKD